MTSNQLLDDACFNLLDGKQRVVISRSEIFDYLNVPGEAVTRIIAAYMKMPETHRRYRIQDAGSENEIEIQQN